jgi:hypothetical protein
MFFWEEKKGHRVSRNKRINGEKNNILTSNKQKCTKWLHEKRNKEREKELEKRIWEEKDKVICFTAAVWVVLRLCLFSLFFVFGTFKTEIDSLNRNGWLLFFPRVNHPLKELGNRSIREMEQIQTHKKYTCEVASSIFLSIAKLED